MYKATIYTSYTIKKKHYKVSTEASFKKIVYGQTSCLSYIENSGKFTIASTRSKKQDTYPMSDAK